MKISQKEKDTTKRTKIVDYLQVAVISLEIQK